MNSRCCLLSLWERCSGKKPCCSFLLFCGACCRVMVFSAMEKLRRKSKELFSSRGCLGCCTKPPIIASMDDPSRRLKYSSAAGRKDNVSEDFWNSSPLGMDNSAGQSQRSISSIGISNHTSDPQSSGSSQNDPPEFINHGLLLWNQLRQQWIGNKKSEKKTQVKEPRMISGNATYENLLGTNKPFLQPIPLGEMVDFLVDVWEQDGLYD